MKKAPVDAGTILQERKKQESPAEAPAESAGQLGTVVEGARGRAEITGRKRPWPVGERALLLMMGTAILGIMAVLVRKAHRVQQEREMATKSAQHIAIQVPRLELSLPADASKKQPPSPARAPFDRPQPGAPDGGAAALPDAGDASANHPPTEAELVEQRRLARGFGEGANEARDERINAPPPAERAGEARAPDKLGEKLEPLEMKPSAASMLPDRDYLVTQGSMLDCVLETKLVSTAPGMTSCHLTRNIYSASGRVVLLDRGSKVVGHYQGGLQQGQARIFVVWSRVETPSGVVVELGSPGVGPLGEAGLGGWTDTHFWDRFGAAILMSVIQDASNAAASRAAGPTQSTIIPTSEAAAGKGVAEKSLEPAINIPPTLYKNQGERVGILVARDLDFRRVYALEPTARAEP